MFDLVFVGLGVVLFTPLGGLVPLFNMPLGRISPGGVGAGPPPSAGAHGPLFIGLLLGVIVILYPPQYFPALALGPIVEHFLMLAGKTF